MKLVFGDIVVVDDDQIGVVVKCWGRAIVGDRPPHVEVYVRNYHGIREYPVKEVERYQVRHKKLNDEELEYQANAKAKE